jgi:hypothetical protein
MSHNHFLCGVYSFKTNYPNWEPDVNCKQFMSQLVDFRLRNDENDLAMGQLFSSLQQSQSPNQLGPWGAPMPGHSLLSRSVNSTVRDRFGHSIPFARPTNEAKHESPLGENSEQIYWLDKFYTASQSPQILASGLLVDERHRDGRETDPFSLGSRYGDIGERLSIRVDHLNRLNKVGMNLQASTQGILGNQGVGQAAGESRWWARKGPGSVVGPGESSFEPPKFARGHMPESQDDFCESEDHERDWSSQRYARGTFGSSQISEDESSHLEFPFGDVYQRPRGEPALKTFGGPVASESSSD